MLIPVEAVVESDVMRLLLVDRPVEADVDREATLLSVVDRPVESEITPD